MQDYNQSRKISCPPEKCFNALTQHINLWWSEHAEGLPNSVGAVFTVRFGKTFKTMKVVELIENHKVVWRCIDSYIDLNELTNKSEWNDTRIEWDITSFEDGIMLHITHVGLNEAVGCYHACEKGWDYFFTNSLIPFLENDSGKPFHAQQPN